MDNIIDKKLMWSIQLLNATVYLQCLYSSNLSLEVGSSTIERHTLQM